MWYVLILFGFTLALLKLFSRVFYWRDKGIPYENVLQSWYKILVTYQRQPLNEAITESVKNLGAIYGTFKAFTPTLVIADPEIARDVMVKQFQNFFGRSFEFKSGDPLWDNMVIRLPYNEWKGVRSVMGHTFTSSKMRSMIPKLDLVAKRTVDKFAINAGQEVEIKKDIKAFGMDSICAISFGIDLNCIENPESEFVKEASDIFKPGFEIVLFMLLPGIIKYMPFIHFPRKSTSAFFGRLTKQILAEKKKNLDEAIKNNTADIIDLHLISQRDDPNSVLTDDILASQALLFFTGGLDTTVLALEFATYYLTINKTAQERAYKEIKSVMGSRVNVEYDDLQKMKYLEGCILETLRLTPLSFIFDRICTKETEVAGIKIEPGMIIEFAIPVIHRNPKYFERPDEFLPERFLKNDEVSSDLSAFFTFGDGPKNCVGRRLALMNIQVILVNMLLKFTLEKTDNTPIPLILKPGMRSSDVNRDPIMLRLVPRS